MQNTSYRDVSKPYNARLSDAHSVDAMHQVHGKATHAVPVESVLGPNTLS